MHCPEITMPRVGIVGVELFSHLVDRSPLLSAGSYKKATRPPRMSRSPPPERPPSCGSAAAALCPCARPPPRPHAASPSPSQVRREGRPRPSCPSPSLPLHARQPKCPPAASASPAMAMPRRERTHRRDRERGNRARRASERSTSLAFCAALAKPRNCCTCKEHMGQMILVYVLAKVFIATRLYNSSLAYTPARRAIGHIVDIVGGISLPVPRNASLSAALINLWRQAPSRRGLVLRRHSQSKLVGMMEHLVSIP